jgi:hypothetical protein
MKNVKLKPGMQVRIKSNLCIYRTFGMTVPAMEQYEGKTTTIIKSHKIKNIIKLDIDNGYWNWSPSMLELISEPINLIEILKDVPIGTKFYCTTLGTVCLLNVKDASESYPIVCKGENLTLTLTEEGHQFSGCPDAECVLFPSKNQRDWSKYKIPVPELNFRKDIAEELSRSELIDRLCEYKEELAIFKNIDC